MNERIALYSNIALLVSSAFFAFNVIIKIFSKRLKDQVKDIADAFSIEYQKKQIINRAMKQKKLGNKAYRNVFGKLELLVQKSGIQDLIFFMDSRSVIALCVVSAVLVYIVFENIFKVVSVGFITSVPGFFLPITFLGMLAQKREADIEKVLGDYLLQLKNSTRIHNDIIEAFRNVQDKCMEPLKTYTRQFLAEVNSGIGVEKALQSFKEKVDMKKFKLFITNVQYCYIYGGNFTQLLDKTHKLISDIQKEKRLRIRETRSARIVIIVLIVMDIYVYLNFIMTEPDYMNIMRNTFLGQLILNVNFLSIWFMLWLSYSVKKLDY